MKKRVAILASGGGSNCQALLDAMRAPGYPAEAVVVFSNKPGAGVLERARRAGVPAEQLDHKAFPTREDYDRALVALLSRYRPDLICLAGYMRIGSQPFFDAFAGRILNIHPALLPAFGGPGMYGHHVHEAVLKAKAAQSGATVHWVTQEVDAGPIVMQAPVPVLPTDTVETLAARVLEQEHRLYPEALKKVCEA
jgi:phosphoribosylglycinamide formyltransferase-1